MIGWCVWVGVFMCVYLCFSYASAMHTLLPTRTLRLTTISPNGRASHTTHDRHINHAHFQPIFQPVLRGLPNRDMRGSWHSCVEASDLLPDWSNTQDDDGAVGHWCCSAHVIWKRQINANDSFVVLLVLVWGIPPVSVPPRSLQWSTTAERNAERAKIASR